MASENNNTRTMLYWNTLLTIPVHALVFVVSIIVTRILDPDDFGIMAIAMMLIGYSNLLTNFGFSEAVIQKSITNQKTISSLFTLNLAMSTLLTMLFIGVSGSAAVFFNNSEIEDVIKIMSAVFIITSFYSLPEAILRRDMKFKAVSIINAIHSLLMSMLTLILALNGFGYYALVYGQLIPLVLVTLLICLKVRFVPRIYFNRDYMGGIFHFGGWNFLKSQLHFFGNYADRFIIGRWLNSTSLGFYDKSITLSEAPYETLTINVNSVMFSSFSAAKGDQEKLQRQFKKSLALVAYLNFPMYLGFVVIAPYFVNALLGDKWSPMIMTFQIILVGFLLSSFGGLLASMNVGIGRYKELTIRLFFAVILFVVLCILLLGYGIEGIAVAFLLFRLTVTISWMNLALNNIGVKWSEVLASIKSAAFAAATMFIFVALLSHYLFNEHTIFNMACLIIAGVLSYLLYVIVDPSEIISDLRAQIWTDLKKMYDTVFPAKI